MDTVTARNELAQWQVALQKNCFTENKDLEHSISYYFPKQPALTEALQQFGEKITQELEPLVQTNDFRMNLPRLEPYNSIGERIDQVMHSPLYTQAGDIIYGSDLMSKLAQPGKLLHALLIFFLSSHAGEAGHNCPIACSAGLIRILRNHPEIPDQTTFLEKLTIPSFTDNYTGAQFLTELQGGSDVGLNTTCAVKQDNGLYAITGEKWFCSNINAELILLTARYNENVAGTRGLGLFLVPAKLPSGEKNHFFVRRLKEKIGTRALASAEVDFKGALAYAIEPLDTSFKTTMEDVLHISRLFNSFCVLGMGRRAFQIAFQYAGHREAFGQRIIQYPLVQQNLARIKVENTALTSAICATTALQDQADLQRASNDQALLLRLLANLNKSISALWSVDHIHHCIDVLAGNGAIESFSSLPRLLRDSIVCENWEGTHNTLYMQILRDIHKYEVDKIFFSHMDDLLKHIEASDDKKILQLQVEQLQKRSLQLKAAEAASQTLLVKEWVYTIMSLYSGTQLLKEALHQIDTLHDHSKYWQWQYFAVLHLKSNIYDRHDLKLITKTLLPD